MAKKVTDSLQKEQKRRKQDRALKTYEKLVACAIKQLANTDIGHIRFSQISKITKIPQSLIDYHFPSLQSLQMAMIQHEFQKGLAVSIAAIEKNQKNPRKALEAYMQAPFLLADKDKEFCAVWTGYFHLITIHKEMAMFNSVLQNNARERITNLVNAILVSERLQLHKQHTAMELSYSILGIMTGYSLMAITNANGSLVEWAKKAVVDGMVLFDYATRR